MESQTLFETPRSCYCNCNIACDILQAILVYITIYLEQKMKYGLSMVEILWPLSNDYLENEENVTSVVKYPSKISIL